MNALDALLRCPICGDGREPSAQKQSMTLVSGPRIKLHEVIPAGGGAEHRSSTAIPIGAPNLKDSLR
jgi:hypothetical protein